MQSRPCISLDAVHQARRAAFALPAEPADFCWNFPRKFAILNVDAGWLQHVLNIGRERLSGLSLSALLAIWPRQLLLACAMFAACIVHAQAAEIRLALVIGNSAYASKSLPPLGNPVRDAALIQKNLKAVGFSVHLVENADKATLVKSFREFARQVEAAGRDAVAVVYYAGHGTQDTTQANYLLPVDADIQSQSDLADQAVPVDTLVRQLELASPKIALVILDACRSNATASATRGGTRGLGVQQERRGLLVAFSTEPGKTSLDGDGDNSPYAQALAAEIVKPNIDVEQMFKKVRISVMETTKSEQVPLVTGVLNGFFYLVPAGNAAGSAAVAAIIPPVPVAATPQGTTRNPDVEYSQAVLTDTVDTYKQFLQDFPDHSKKAIIVALIDRKNEEILWKQAERTTDDAEKARIYDRLVLSFDHGAFTEKARQRLQELRDKGTARPNPVIVRTVPPAPAPAAASYYYVTGLDPYGDNFLSLRSGPGGVAGTAAELKRMGPNTLLTLLETRGKWMHVRLLDGETGWAYSKYVACCRTGTGR